MDDTDEDDSDIDDGADDGMVLDQEESGFGGQERTNNSDLDDDQASLSFKYSDDETENDSVMMVSYFINSEYYLNFCMISFWEGWIVKFFPLTLFYFASPSFH